MIQRIRFTNDGMQIETQEGSKIVHTQTVGYQALRRILRDINVSEYLRRGRHGDLAIPDSVYEFSLSAE